MTIIITKNTLKISMIANSSICSIFYSIVAFVEWDLYNPIKWIIDIPTYSNENRFGLLFAIVCYLIFIFVGVPKIFFEIKSQNRRA